MEEKTIAQMKQEFREFYFGNVKKNLNDWNVKRKTNALNCISALSLIIGITLIIFAIFLYEPLMSVFNPIALHLKTGLQMYHFLIAGTVMIFLPMCYAKQTDKTGITCDFSGENDIKRAFMLDFLKIFGYFHWSKSNYADAVKCLKFYKKLNIMNSFILPSFDDRICGTYKNVKFNILEIRTGMITPQNILLLLTMSPLILFAVVFLIPVFLIIKFIFMAIGFKIPAVFPIWYLLIPLIAIIPFAAFFKHYSPFRGVFIEFDMNKNFEGHTFLFENTPSGHKLKFDHSKFEEVILEDSEFCQKYKIFSDSQIEARYVLTTAFIERFKNMRTAFKAKFIRAAFKDNKIIIAIDAGKDLFAMGELLKTTDSSTFSTLFNEVLSVLELIDELKLNQKIGL